MTFEDIMRRVENRQTRELAEWTERERKGLAYENGPEDPERRISTIVSRATLPNHARI